MIAVKENICVPPVSIKVAAVILFVSLSISSCAWLQKDEFLQPSAQDLIRKHKFNEAEILLRKELLTAENAFRAKQNDRSGAVKETKQLATAYRNLAVVLYELGRYADSEPYFQKACETYSEHFGRGNEFVANCLHSLAACYYRQGKLEEAEKYYKEELDVLKTAKTPNPLKLAITANNLAAIYQRLGEDVEAEKYFSWALSLCAKFKKTEKESDQMIDILNNLALFYEKEGDYGQGLNMVEQALALEDKRSKGFSENRIRSLLVRASIEKSTFDVEGAESDYKLCLDLISKSSNQNSELACEARDKYADLLLVQRKFAEAEPQFEKCIAACEAAHGAEHPTVAERLSDFAILYRRTKRYEEAEKLLRRALAIQEKTIGIDTAGFLSTVHRLGSVLADENKYAEADKLYQEILPRLKERIGADHPFVADTIDNWAEFVEHSRGKREAEELHESARLIRKKLAHSLSPKYGPAK